jgi:hypothetical protein
MPKATIIIPKTHEDSGAVTEAARQHLADQFGGFTEYSGNGAWKNSDGDLVEEEIVRLEAAHSRMMRLRTEFYVIAHNVKHFCDEEEVYVEFSDNEINFI